VKICYLAEHGHPRSNNSPRRSPIAKISAYFSGVFGKSPFYNLQLHARLCIEAVEELLLLFPAANGGDWALVEKHYQHIAALENEADERKREIRGDLPRGFFLPVARADLLDLLGRQDEIANGARDVAGLVYGRHMQFPESLQDKLIEFVECTIAACEKAQKVVDELDELIQTGFRGPQARRVVTMIEAIETQEARSDQLKIELRSALFEIEQDLPAIQAIFYYQALDLVGEIADVAERVGHRVQMMLAR